MADVQFPQTSRPSPEDITRSPAVGKSGSCRRKPWLPLALAALLVVAAVAVRTAHRGGQGKDPAEPAAPTKTVLRVEDGPQAGGAVLDIASQPSGATVILNGRLAGATPIHLEHAPPGNYCLRLEKSGCEPLCRSVELGAAGLSLKEQLEVLPTGSISVSVNPVGAEVLLDGELIGNTPLKASSMPVGNYELLIRKTNHDSYSTMVAVGPGEALTFSGFELKDKVMAMLEAELRSEPQRLAHYIDLGHYLFVNNRMDDAAAVFAQGMEMANMPLDFNGAGYPGAEHMTAEEMVLEKRLRLEDVSRFQREREKHLGWPHKNIQAFREKLVEDEGMLRQKNVASWAWVEQAAHWNVRGLGTKPDRAAQLYLDHIAAVGPDALSVPDAYIALMETYLMNREVAKARGVFDKFCNLCRNNSSALLKCGSMIYPKYDRMKPAEQAQVLELAQQALRKGLELTKDSTERVKGLFDLASVLSYQGRHKEAVPLFEQCISATANPATKEEQSLRLADALFRAKRILEAEALYIKLQRSKNPQIREKANNGLMYLAPAKARLKDKGK